MNKELIEKMESYSITATLYSQDIADLFKEAIREIKRLEKQSTPEGFVAFYLPADAVEKAKGNEATLYYHLASEINAAIQNTISA